VKNLFEIKNAQRMLIEGNVFENNWAEGQGGSAIVLKSVNQGGACPWCVAKDHHVSPEPDPQQRRRLRAHRASIPARQRR
jgi:hypothetical protein